MNHLQELYLRIKDKMKKIEFHKLWNGFHEYEFALYTNEKVCFNNQIFDVTDAFRGNTAIKFKGRYIAIWKIEDDFKDNEDEDILTANMIHEMFHAFQICNREGRFPDDIKGLNYPMDIENFELKFEENRILTKAYREKDKDEKRRLLSIFCGYRQKRCSRIGDIIQYEYMAETAEGMAEYVGTKALKMLSEEKFILRINQYMNYLDIVSPIYFDIRRISYYTGVILLLTAFEVGINLEHTIGEEKNPVFMQILRELKIIEPDSIHRNGEIRQELTKAQEVRKKLIATFFSKPYKEYIGNYVIEGYDPMNMFKMDRMIYGNHFWILRNKNDGREIQLMGEVVLNTEKDGTINKYWVLL